MNPSATSTATSACPARRCSLLNHARPDARSVSNRFKRKHSAAGTQAKTPAETRAVAAANPSTGQFNPSSESRASRSGRIARIARYTAVPTATPAAPPMVHNSIASASNCRRMRARDAPNVKRSAISLRRSAARAESRLVTFTHAINRTQAAPAKSARSAPLTSPYASSCSPASFQLHPEIRGLRQVALYIGRDAVEVSLRVAHRYPWLHLRHQPQETTRLPLEPIAENVKHLDVGRYICVGRKAQLKCRRQHARQHGRTFAR